MLNLSAFLDEFPSTVFPKIIIWRIWLKWLGSDII